MVPGAHIFHVPFHGTEGAFCLVFFVAPRYVCYMYACMPPVARGILRFWDHRVRCRRCFVVIVVVVAGLRGRRMQGGSS